MTNHEATPETHKRSALYMLAHDEWCSHDETDDGIACDCHLSAIASLRARIVALEERLSDIRAVAVDHDGYHEAEGLKRTIDKMARIAAGKE